MFATAALLALFGCNGCTQTQPADLEAEKAQAEATKPLRIAPAGNVSLVTAPEGGTTNDTPAPARAVWGLEMGASTTAEMAKWFAARQLECPTGAMGVDKRVVTTCRSGLSPTMLPGRTFQGTLNQLVLMHTATGVLMEAVATRGFTEPASAAADYQDTVAAITQELGAPSSARKLPGPDALTVGLERFNTAWEFSDLTVSVTASRTVSGNLSVSERWQAR